jgi:hypothetical protein
MESMEAEVIELRPPSPAAKPPATEADLRAALAEAIDRRHKADERAAAAKASAQRAEAHRADARKYVDGFREAHDAKVREAREIHAKAISEAIRQGRTVPGTPPAAVIDHDALQAAQDQCDALEVSATYLGLEANEAATEAGKAMEAVHVAAASPCDGSRRQARLCGAASVP